MGHTSQQERGGLRPGRGLLGTPWSWFLELCPTLACCIPSIYFPLGCVPMKPLHMGFPSSALGTWEKVAKAGAEEGQGLAEHV